jgi:hypothetical protein
MTGTRAYAVREDLKTYNRRLFEYAQQGGNVIVPYNTPETVAPTDSSRTFSLPKIKKAGAVSRAGQFRVLSSEF